MTEYEKFDFGDHTSNWQYVNEVDRVEEVLDDVLQKELAKANMDEDKIRTNIETSRHRYFGQQSKIFNYQFTTWLFGITAFSLSLIAFLLIVSISSTAKLVMVAIVALVYIVFMTLNIIDFASRNKTNVNRYDFAKPKPKTTTKN